MVAARHTQIQVQIPAGRPFEEKHTEEPPTVVTPTDSGRAQLCRSPVLRGDLSESGDLLISGQFKGTVNVQGPCPTNGPEGKGETEIQALAALRSAAELQQLR